MKLLKLCTAILAIGLITIQTSCSDDDGATTTTAGGSGTGGGAGTGSGTISFDGTDYTMKAGLVIDYGATDIVGNTKTHYNYDFYVADETLKQFADSANGPYYGYGPTTSIGIYLELFSPDTTGFSTGTFNFVDGNSRTSANTGGQRFFSYAYATLDSNGNTDGDLDGPETQFTGGAVIVSSTGTNNYTINYSLTAAGGKNLSGSYTGSFIYEKAE